jgi:hypothetical protein
MTVPNNNGGIPIWAWLSALGGLFVSLWGIIWGLQNKRIGDLKTDVEEDLEEKASKEHLAKISKEVEFYVKAHGKSLKEMGRSLSKEFSLKNDLTLEKLKDIKEGQLENKGLIQNLSGRFEDMNKKMMSERVETAQHREWVKNKFIENEICRKRMEKDIEGLKRI